MHRFSACSQDTIPSAWSPPVLHGWQAGGCHPRECPTMAGHSAAERDQGPSGMKQLLHGTPSVEPDFSVSLPQSDSLRP